MDKQQNVDMDNKMTKEIKKQKWLFNFLFHENDLFISKYMSVCICFVYYPTPCFPTDICLEQIYCTPEKKKIKYLAIILLAKTITQ